MIGKRVWIRATLVTIEIFHLGQRVASHRRSFGPKGTTVTCPEHQPKSHRDYGEWPPERLHRWVESIGVAAGQVATAILAAGPTPEVGYRRCLALIRDSKKYGAQRTEAACRRALAIGSPTRKSV